MKVTNIPPKTTFGTNVFFKDAVKLTHYEAGQLARDHRYISEEATKITPIFHRGGIFVIDDTTLVGKLLKTILGENAVYSKDAPLKKAIDDIIAIPNQDTLIVS